MKNFQGLETKQKVMLVAIILLLAIAVYMAYETFFASDEVAPAPAVQNTASSQDQSTLSRAAPETTAHVEKVTTVTKKVEMSAAEAPSPEQMALLAKNQQLQEQYLNLVNRYQMAQMENKLAKTNAEIAAAKLATAKSLVDMQKIEGQIDSAISTEKSAMDKSSKGFEAMFVGKKDGEWTAVIGGGGSFYDVRNGTILPDGYKVIDINAKAVVLTRGDDKIVLPIPETIDQGK